MRQRFEYAAAWLFVKGLGILPRWLARAAGHGLVRVLFLLRPPLRRAAIENLRLAYPEWSDAQRREVIRKMVRNIGWLAAEFAHFPGLNRENVERVIIQDGFEHFQAGLKRGKGVLLLTGHIGPWELGSFAHSVYAGRIYFLARALDNPRVDALVNRYRGLLGNRPIEKNDSVRAVLRALGSGEAVGILADNNTTRSEGVFVSFFGIPACTTTGLARFALHTDAAVVPGYTLWDDSLGKYRLCYEPAVPLARTGDQEADIVENTQRFTRAIEEVVRRAPDQWLWVHRRWKTRPEGEGSVYPD
ncbi:MAG: lysophospholipid acyltransferase family protein [Candidatus Acidiferrales bacterium]